MKQKMGFRIDFILYSFVPILVGWIAVLKKRIESRVYLFILNIYTFINGIWLLCIYATFTNRIAYLSWGLYPILLIYPFLKEDWGDGQYKIFKWVAYGHLGFTLFMNLVYYWYVESVICKNFYDGASTHADALNSIHVQIMNF